MTDQDTTENQPIDGDLIAEEPVVREKSLAEKALDVVVPPAEAGRLGTAAPAHS